MLGSKFYLCKTNLYANAPDDENKLDSRIRNAYVAKALNHQNKMLTLLDEDLKINPWKYYN